MMCWGEMFGELVYQVGSTGSTVYVEVTLAHSVSNPVESHVYSFTSFLFHSVAGYACGAKVVGGDGSWWLWMAELDEGLVDNFGFVGIKEETIKFRICC